MAEKEDGGPAFARASFASEAGGNEHQDGMSLRDYFAAAALNGLLSKNGGELGPKNSAYWAYRHADAMLAEKKKRDDKDNGGGR